MSITKGQASLPWFSFYPADFLSSTADMDPACVGAYIRLLAWQWVRGIIPSDPAILARICGGFDPQWWALIRPRLIEVPGGLAHPRLLAEREKGEAVAAKRRANIQRINDRAIHRAIDRPIECPTSTTTSTTTPPPGGGGGGKSSSWQATMDAICRRERKSEEEVRPIVEAVHRVLIRNLEKAGASNAVTASAWLAALDWWATTGSRPTDFIKQLTDNMADAKDVDRIIEYRIANRHTKRTGRRQDR